MKDGITRPVEGGGGTPERSRKPETKPDRTMEEITRPRGEEGGVTHRSTLPPGTRLREFELVEVLGHGGFGVTYRGWDTDDNVAVAIKEYMPLEYAVRDSNGGVYPRDEHEGLYSWGLDEFLKEAQMLVRFNHPGIVQVRQFFEAFGTAYIVMEYIEGQTLLALYEAEKTLSEDRLRELLAPILAGLEQVHEAGWLHQDIKPGNIMLRDASTPVLIDFGAAQAATAHSHMEGVVTPGFSPLEQYGHQGQQAGPWTDLYAVGAVLYRGMTGIIPNDALARHEKDDLEPVGKLAKRQYSKQLTAAVDWALKLNTESRPRSIDEWHDTLEQSDDALSPPPPPSPPRRKRRLWVLAMIAILIVVVSALWWE